MIPNEPGKIKDEGLSLLALIRLVPRHLLPRPLILRWGEGKYKIWLPSPQ